jgi:hypothetical protein
MRLTIVLASIVLAALCFTTGCLVPGCGAFSGGGDREYQRGNNETILLCENGGIVANLASGTIEGQYQGDGNQGTATEGDTGQRAFGWTLSGDDLTSPELGAPFTQADLNATALDHADVLCQSLTTRSWWPAQPTDTVASK